MAYTNQQLDCMHKSLFRLPPKKQTPGPVEAASSSSQYSMHCMCKCCLQPVYECPSTHLAGPLVNGAPGLEANEREPSSNQYTNTLVFTVNTFEALCRHRLSSMTLHCLQQQLALRNVDKKSFKRRNATSLQVSDGTCAEGYHKDQPSRLPRRFL